MKMWMLAGRRITAFIFEIFSFWFSHGLRKIWKIATNWNIKCSCMDKKTFENKSGRIILSIFFSFVPQSISLLFLSISLFWLKIFQFFALSFWSLAHIFFTLTYIFCLFFCSSYTFAVLTPSISLCHLDGSLKGTHMNNKFCVQIL